MHLTVKKLHEESLFRQKILNGRSLFVILHENPSHHWNSTTVFSSWDRKTWPERMRILPRALANKKPNKHQHIYYFRCESVSVTKRSAAFRPSRRIYQIYTTNVFAYKDTKLRLSLSYCSQYLTRRSLSFSSRKISIRDLLCISTFRTSSCVPGARTYSSSLLYADSFMMGTAVFALTWKRVPPDPKDFATAKFVEQLDTLHHVIVEPGL